jgi:hypothetical protein
VSLPRARHAGRPTPGRAASFPRSTGRASARSLQARIAGLDWAGLGLTLDERGFATTGPLLSPAECAGAIALWDDPARFRGRVDMARHRFGVGEYRYFAAPLPPLVATLRHELYPHLAPVANRWAARLGQAADHPDTLEAFLRHCARHGQTRPTPLLLRYEADGYNCLHQDLYGPVAFPLQVTVLLSQPGRDFTGGQFLLVEQRPRAQSRGETVELRQGEAIVFATRQRPARGTRGVYRVAMRHGVSRITSGLRQSLGIIFHDAE